MNTRQHIISCKMANNVNGKKGKHMMLNADVQMPEPILPDNVMDHMGITILPCRDDGKEIKLAIVGYVREGKAKNESFVIGYLNLTDGFFMFEDLKESIKVGVPAGIESHKT